MTRRVIQGRMQGEYASRRYRCWRTVAAPPNPPGQLNFQHTLALVRQQLFYLPQQRVLANPRDAQHGAVPMETVKMPIEKKGYTRPDCDGGKHAVAILEPAIQNINGLPRQTVDQDTCRIQAGLRTEPG